MPESGPMNGIANTLPWSTFTLPSPCSVRGSSLRPVKVIVARERALGTVEIEVQFREPREVEVLSPRWTPCNPSRAPSRDPTRRARPRRKTSPRKLLNHIRSSVNTISPPMLWKVEVLFNERKIHPARRVDLRDEVRITSAVELHVAVEGRRRGFVEAERHERVIHIRVEPHAHLREVEVAVDVIEAQVAAFEIVRRGRPPYPRPRRVRAGGCVR